LSDGSSLGSPPLNCLERTRMTHTSRCRDAIDTVVFDMDGVLFDTEQVWNMVRREFALAHGGHWDDDDQRAVMGDNSEQWSRYMHEACGITLAPDEIYRGVLNQLRVHYTHHLVIYPGAHEAVAALAGRYRLGVASSSPRELIETALRAAGMADWFSVLVSSDEVAHGKPEPDVYLEACGRLGSEPFRAAAIEDSTNGIRAAAAAGLAVIAIPNPEFPPPTDVVGLAEKVLTSISSLAVETIEGLVGEVCGG
jgi:HAD superfamily hydrolase (TIGR01509 family)